MEIPVINRFSDINSFPNPSCLSQALSSPKVSQPHYIFLKWGALFLAILLASFTTILNKIKLIILKLQNHFHKTKPILDFSDDWSDISDGDDDDDETSSLSSSFSDDEDDDQRPNLDDCKSKYEDFCFLGSSSSGVFRWKTTEPMLMQRPRSFGDLWSDLSKAKSVVNLWDNFGLFDYESCDENEEDDRFSSLLTTDSEFPSGLMLSAAVDDARKAALRVWDTRVGRQIPAILAEWRPQIGKIVGVSTFSGEKVLLRGGISGGLAVGDMRKLSSPLMNLTESDVRTRTGASRVW